MSMDDRYKNRLKIAEASEKTLVNLDMIGNRARRTGMEIGDALMKAKKNPGIMYPKLR